jgi:hypothetical protein
MFVPAGEPFLPAPRLPSTRVYPPSEQVAAVVGAELAKPLVELETAVADAEHAVTDLERNLPGGLGDGWQQALTDDAAAYAAGTRPKRWKAATLLATDPERWATAMAACNSVPTVGRRCERHMDRPEDRHDR